MAATFAQAMAEGSSAALIAFIARHPEGALVEEARRLLAGRTTPDEAKTFGPDADVIDAFDAARLRGGAAAMREFARRLPGHPLAVEALKPFWAR